MTTEEIKLETQKTLDNIPENVLQNILDYLKEIQGKISGQSEAWEKLTRHFN